MIYLPCLKGTFLELIKPSKLKNSINNGHFNINLSCVAVPWRAHTYRYILNGKKIFFLAIKRYLTQLVIIFGFFLFYFYFCVFTRVQLVSNKWSSICKNRRRSQHYCLPIPVYLLTIYCIYFAYPSLWSPFICLPLSAYQYPPPLPVTDSY